MRRSTTEEGVVELIEVGIAVSAVCLVATTLLGVTNFINGRRLRREIERVDGEVQDLLQKAAGSPGEASAKPGS